MRTYNLRLPLAGLVAALVALGYASPVAAQDITLPSLGKPAKKKGEEAKPPPEEGDVALPSLGKPKGDKKPADDGGEVSLPALPALGKPKTGDKKPADDVGLPPLKPKDEPATVEAKPIVDRAVARGPLFPLNAGQTGKVLVKLFDSSSQPISAPISITADLGSVTAPVETAPGTFQATYAAPDDPPPGGSANIKIEVKDQPKPVTAQVIVIFAKPEPVVAVPPPPPPPPTLVADKPADKPADQPPPADQPKKLGKPARVVFGEPTKVRPGQLAKITFTVEDEDGNKLPLEGVEVKSNAGTISNVREEKGAYVADFQANEKERGDLTLFAESKGEALLGEGVVTVRKPGFRPEDKRVGVDVALFAGGLTNFGKVVSPSFELNGEVQIQKKFRAGLLVGLAPAGASNVQEASGARSANFSLSVIPLYLRGGYVQEVGPVDLYGGGMIGLALISGTVSSAIETKFSEQALGMAAFAGAGLPLGPGTALLELRLSRVHLDYQSPDGTLKVTGGLGGLSGALGYKIEL